MPIPQHEFGFVPTTFSLFSEATLDGERLSREQAEMLAARQHADQAQAALFAPPSTPLSR